MQMSDVFEACLNGDYDGVASFVNQGWDLDTKDDDGQTLLHVAYQNGRVDIADLLLKHGCDTNVRTEYNGHTALHMACIRGHSDIVNVLIKHGCDVRVRDNQGRTPLHMASCRWKVRTLPDVAGMKNVRQEMAKLLAAIKDDDILDAKFSLMSGIQITFYSDTKYEFFSHQLVYCANDTSGGGFDRWRWEDNPLFLASFLGKLNFVEMLLNYETVRVDSTDEYGRTALFYACQGGHLEVVRHLVKEGANINHWDDDGNTPLHEAVHFRRVEVVRELVASGADHNRKNDDNLSVLDLVCQRMDSSDEGKLRIHREMLEIIGRQRQSVIISYNL